MNAPGLSPVESVPPADLRTCARCGVDKPFWKFPKRVRRHGSLKNCRQCNSELRQQNLDCINAMRAKRDDVDWFRAMRNHDCKVANRYDAPGYYRLDELVALFEKWDFRCAYCGGDAQCRDHVVPFYLGGTNWISNVLPSCLRCNNRKGAGTLASFVERWFPGVTLDEFMSARGLVFDASGVPQVGPDVGTNSPELAFG